MQSTYLSISRVLSEARKLIHDVKVKSEVGTKHSNFKGFRGTTRSLAVKPKCICKLLRMCSITTPIRFISEIKLKCYGRLISLLFNLA